MVPQHNPMGPPTKLRKVMKERLECVQKTADWKGNYETSLRNLQ
jgi:hypothetical protein